MNDGHVPTNRDPKMNRVVSLTLCVAMLAIAGCNSKEYDQITDEVRQLSSEMSDLGAEKTVLYDRKSEADRLISRFAHLQRDESRLLIELDEINKYQRGLEATVEYLDSQLSIWLPATQRSLEGLSLGSIRVGESTILNDAVVVKLDNLTVEVKHRDGTSVVELSELDEPVRKQLLHAETVQLSSEVAN